MWWALIDWDIQRLCEFLWPIHPPGQEIVRSFDKRAETLAEIARKLYAAEPDEWRTFAWLLQRLKTANGRRDAICHGIPGTKKIAGKEIDSLLIPFPARPTKYSPISVLAIEQLAALLDDLMHDADSGVKPPLIPG
jgi:hypothetical protein